MSPKILSLQNNKGELVSPEVIWEIHYEGKKKRALIGWDLVTRQRVAATIGLVTSQTGTEKRGNTYRSNHLTNEPKNFKFAKQ